MIGAVDNGYGEKMEDKVANEECCCIGRNRLTGKLIEYI